MADIHCADRFPLEAVGPTDRIQRVRTLGWEKSFIPLYFGQNLAFLAVRSVGKRNSGVLAESVICPQ